MAQVNNGLQYRIRSLGDDFRWDVFVFGFAMLALAGVLGWLLARAVFEVASVTARFVEATLEWALREFG